MPYQNRIDPYGRLHAVNERGSWVGNRGVLINDNRVIVRPFRLQRWITCSLEFKERHRVVFTPKRWTELFFLDEATAMSAGHRPCAECRRERYKAFRTAWLGDNERKIRAEEIDAVMHAERELDQGGKKTFQAGLATLPNGTMIEVEDKPMLVWDSRLWLWSFAGYELLKTTIEATTLVTVLTPESSVTALRHGYVPQVHQSLS